MHNALPTPEQHGYIEPAEQLAYFRGLTAGQHAANILLSSEHQREQDFIVDEVMARDKQLQATEAVLEGHKDKLAEAEEERDRFKSLSELGAFGGLLNKNTYIERATRIVENDRRQETLDAPKIVAFLDVDDLNKLNSQFTETIVDEEILEPLAQIVAQHRREGDVTGIWGGDEIGKLLQKMSLEQAVEYLTSIRDDINGIKINSSFAGAGGTKVTVSIGIATVRNGETYKQAEARAARAKEYAKEQPGKNAIINYDDVPEDWVPTRKSRAS